MLLQLAYQQAGQSVSWTVTEMSTYNKSKIQQQLLYISKELTATYIIAIVEFQATLFNDVTIAKNFVIDVYFRCLQILYQIAFFYNI